MTLNYFPENFIHRKLPKQTKLQEFSNWVENNCQGVYFWDELNIFGLTDEVAFELESDAVLFDMTWY